MTEVSCGCSKLEPIHALGTALGILECRPKWDNLVFPLCIARGAVSLTMLITYPWGKHLTFVWLKTG